MLVSLACSISVLPSFPELRIRLAEIAEHDTRKYFRSWPCPVHLNVMQRLAMQMLLLERIVYCTWWDRRLISGVAE